MKKEGKIIIFSAPSGSGKTTILQRVLPKYKNLSFSISATSRAPRGVEKDGVEYYFLTIEEFRKKIERNDFVEYEEVYASQYYGTLRSELDRIWGLGEHIIFDIDVKGACNIKKQYPQNSISIFIKPPSLQVLESRLRSRGTETEESIKKRLDRAEEELSYAKYFDKVVLNDSLDEAQKEITEIIDSFLSQNS